MAASTTLRFPDDLKGEAQAYADGLGISLNALCAVALREYLDRRKPAPVTLPARVGSQAKAHPPAATSLPPSKGGTDLNGLPRVGANQPCPCGSGQKYKRCHGKP